MDRGIPDGDTRDGGGAADAPDDVPSEPDLTDFVRDLFDPIPFHRAHDVEILTVTPTRARTRLPFQESLVGNPDLQVLHGGAISALMDLTGAAVFMGKREDYTPTVDLRVNYLSAADRVPLTGTATVERRGETIGVASLEVTAEGTVCATGTGVYKLSDA